MALTMTRTRTQTALTKLVELVANIHGELEMLEELQTEMPEYAEVLTGRRQALHADCDALYATLHQFDPELDPSTIGTANLWLRAYGGRSLKVQMRWYIATITKV